MQQHHLMLILQGYARSVWIWSCHDGTMLRQIGATLASCEMVGGIYVRGTVLSEGALGA
ncbi:hypothetical protein XAC3562_1200088 [Xanthomonas citri pv. citri]|uniref:Uncharacterized protein n=1 Tax=Xanthomonas citri pv. citri TaxID=611301 RepID=A0A0U5F9E3_XANCI|nr:hypothetical protein XAC3608_2080023 [Xanthomonas citri pv. citri]CEG14765.1 hypothetical protein XAC3562_1200088 [Xanthomonas citri pv. citri]